MSNEDRRAPGATRIPFDALVEVGGALGPSFEAQAVNISEEGMQLRTAYLPEPGQPLTCRFDGGSGQSVVACGQVVWAQGAERGGEFAVRFTEMDAESVEVLKRLCGVDHAHPIATGSKVRLHIEGLASPMRAKIKDARATAVTVGSELGFLQVGRPLELEDAESGSKRPASIDRVEVAIDPSSHVPQLVVTLRYADVSGSPAQAAEADTRPGPRASRDDLESMEEASTRLKGAFARGAAQVGPALARLARRAKTTVALLASRRTERFEGQRRTTAPPPAGGLTTSGRRVVRGEPGSPSSPELGAAPANPASLLKRRTLVAGAVMGVAVVGALAIKKLHHDPAPGAPAVAQAVGSTEATAAAAAPSSAPAPMSPAPVEPSPPPVQNATSASADEGADGKPAHKKHARVAPFGNGPVHHGNVLHLHMDGPIESIEGAQQPTGFIVKLPGRKSLEAAAPLAARDARIGAIKVSNEPAGAELTVTFKDGVPNYQVTAHGDILAISLAPVGMLDETMAKTGEKGSRAPKHTRHEERKSEEH